MSCNAYTANVYVCRWNDVWEFIALNTIPGLQQRIEKRKQESVNAICQHILIWLCLSIFFEHLAWLYTSIAFMLYFLRLTLNSRACDDARVYDDAMNRIPYNKIIGQATPTKQIGKPFVSRAEQYNNSIRLTVLTVRLMPYGPFNGGGYVTLVFVCMCDRF